MKLISKLRQILTKKKGELNQSISKLGTIQWKTYIDLEEKKATDIPHISNERWYK